MSPGVNRAPKPAALQRSNDNSGSPRSSLLQLQQSRGINQHDFGSDAEGSGAQDEKQPLEAINLRFTVDPPGLLTHDETTVDVVTVPCPGGHPLKTWNRDGLISRYFGAPSMRDADDEAEHPGPSWVRQGIRREADRARILLYEHPTVADGSTLSGLADALLEELRLLRSREKKDRPLLFIGHGVGGIVIKMALSKASRTSKFEGILRQCYGVAFFGG